MQLSHDLIRHRAEFARALANHQYEVGDAGILFPRQKAVVSGAFSSRVITPDGAGALQVDPNVVPVEALDYLLKAGLKGSGALSSWYIAPFLTNTTPGASITAANFDATLNEFTAYDETTRQAYTLPADPTSGAFSNSAAPAVFTASSAVGTDPGVDVWGAGILSVSAKEAITGKIFCASKFAAAHNLKTAYKLTLQYDVNAAST